MLQFQYHLMSFWELFFFPANVFSQYKMLSMSGIVEKDLRQLHWLTEQRKKMEDKNASKKRLICHEKLDRPPIVASELNG